MAVLVLVCIAQFMVILDATIVNVALPSIQADLEMSSTDLQWIVNAYALVFGGFLLLGGRAGDLIGRKRVFLTGVVVFTVGSLICGLAPSSEFLIVARGLQGFGAALVSPAALSIVTTTFAEGAERTKAMGVWAAIAVGGGAVGLLLGGILVDLFSWPWIFFVNIPVGIVAFLLSLRSTRRSASGGALDQLPGMGAAGEHALLQPGPGAMHRRTGPVGGRHSRVGSGSVPPARRGADLGAGGVAAAYVVVVPP